MDLATKAEIYAIKAHQDVNQKYDGYPYTVHLSGAAYVGEKYIHLIPVEDRIYVIAGIWCHDIIEDAMQTYNDVKVKLGEIVAEYAYALTNEKGKNRAERANSKYYAGIKAYKHAVFIKLCDRFANTAYSKMKGSSMFKKYKKEFKEFKEKLYDGRYQELWDDLEKIYED